MSGAKSTFKVRKSFRPHHGSGYFITSKKQRNNKNEKYKTQKIFFSIFNDFFENVFLRN